MKKIGGGVTIHIIAQKLQQPSVVFYMLYHGNCHQGAHPGQHPPLSRKQLMCIFLRHKTQ